MDPRFISFLVFTARALRAWVIKGRKTLGPIVCLPASGEFVNKERKKEIIKKAKKTTKYALTFLFLQKTSLLPKMRQEKWKQKVLVHDDDWSLLYEVYFFRTIETVLQSFQYKILHKIGISNTDQCSNAMLDYNNNNKAG